jgi:hypothetical protein
MLKNQMLAVTAAFIVSTVTLAGQVQKPAAPAGQQSRRNPAPQPPRGHGRPAPVAPRLSELGSGLWSVQEYVGRFKST